MVRLSVQYGLQQHGIEPQMEDDMNTPDDTTRSDVLARIGEHMAKPITHHVVETYSDGETTVIPCRGAAAAESYRAMRSRGLPAKDVARRHLVTVTVEAL